MKRHVLRLWLLVIVISCLALVTSTANHYYPNNAHDSISQFFQISTGTNVTKTNISLLWGGFIATGQLAEILACVISASLADHFGRKFTIMVAIIGIVPGEIMEGAAYYANSIALLYVGRFWSDTFDYVLQQVLLVFICEVALVEDRGKMGTFTTIAHSTGGLIATFLGLREMFGTREQWHIPYFIFGAVGILSLPAVLLLRESPEFLEKKGRSNQDSLIFYRGSEKKKSIFENDLAKLLKNEEKIHQNDGKSPENEENKDEKKILSQESKDQNKNQEIDKNTKTENEKLKTKKENKVLQQQLLLAILMSFTLVNSGLINSYSNLLITSIGFSATVAGYGSVALYGMAIISGIVCSLLTDRISRRVHFIGSCIACGLCLILLSLAQNIYEWTNLDIFAYLAVVFLSGTQIALTFGVKPMFWLVVPEIFPIEYRARAKSLSYFSYAAMGALMNFILPYLETIVGGWIYVIMSLSVWLCIVFAARYLPETAAKESGEIYKSLLEDSKSSYGTIKK